MTPNQKTFCVAPWFQIRNEHDMRKRVCCYNTNFSDSEVTPLDHLNSKANIDLKKDLHSGVRNKACAQCWMTEDNGVRSMRQHLNGSLTNNKDTIDNTWLESYFKNKKDFVSDLLLSADVKVGNTCNHACVMCIPEDSSLIYNKWATDQENEFVKEKISEDPNYLDKIKAYGFKNKNYSDYLQDVVVDNKHIKTVKVLGGEPLLDKMLLEKLSSLPTEQKQKIILLIITNGSVNLLDYTKKLGNFKAIYYSISLEGIGDIQEYSRYGSIWNTLEKNILEYNEVHQNINIQHTLQTATILGFGDLVAWCKKHGLNFSLGNVRHPYYLGARSMPQHIKDMVREQNKSTSIKLTQDIMGELPMVSFNDLLEEFINVNFDRNAYLKFLRYIKWYEKDKQGIKSLEQIYPQLYA